MAPSNRLTAREYAFLGLALLFWAGFAILLSKDTSWNFRNYHWYGPYAFELCPRSVVLSDGVIVADGATYDVLTDDALMSAHRLELPFGFDPRTIRAATAG